VSKPEESSDAFVELVQNILEISHENAKAVVSDAYATAESLYQTVLEEVQKERSKDPECARSQAIAVFLRISLFLRLAQLVALQEALPAVINKCKEHEDGTEIVPEDLPPPVKGTTVINHLLGLAYINENELIARFVGEWITEYMHRQIPEELMVKDPAGQFSVLMGKTPKSESN
jgi:hypothetical protein